MAIWTYSGNVYNSSPAGTTTFPLISRQGNSIAYLQRSHIHVYSSVDAGVTWVEIVASTGYSFNNEGTEIVLTAGIPADTQIKLQRITPYLDEYVTFQASSQLTAGQLNTGELFSIYVDQELSDQLALLNSVAFKYLGATDLTVDTAPVYPENGDFYLNTGAGTVLASWIGIGGDSCVGSEQVIYSSSNAKWEIFVVPSSQVGVVGIVGAGPITVDESTASFPIIGIDEATTSAKGALSAADKTKLDSINAGAGVDIQQNPPSNPDEGQVWWDKNDGRPYIWYEDADSQQWVDFVPNNESQYLYPGGKLQTLQSRLEQSISVYDFLTERERIAVTTGVVDGVADQILDVTAALQAAIDAADGQVLIVPPGIYYISAALEIPKRSPGSSKPAAMYIKGTGASVQWPSFSEDFQQRIPSWGYRASTIQYGSGHGALFDQASRCTFENLVLRYGGARTDDDFVFRDNATHFTMKYCCVQNMSDVLPNGNALTTGACFIHKNIFHACTRFTNSIFLDAKIDNNTFVSFTQTVFNIQPGGGLNSFTNNRFDYCSRNAIQFNPSSRQNRVIGNNFDAHGTQALAFVGCDNRNVIVGNSFWRCGRTLEGDSKSAYLYFQASSNQQIIGNSFRSGTTDAAGETWQAPYYVAAFESCIDVENIFQGNHISDQACYRQLCFSNPLGDSEKCVTIDQVAVMNARLTGETPAFASVVSALGKLLRTPTPCLIYEDKFVDGFNSGAENIILTGAEDGLTITPQSGGVYSMDETSMINNITYNGLECKVINGKQYVSAKPNVWRNQGLWPRNTPLYYIDPSSKLSWAVVRTAGGSPDTWENYIDKS